ncbi:MAG TPA: AMP-binding protein [Candidatus Ozemobacteraceae bacterium]|nr:AMP-binding protein [Candidatus Ozemobacteraceae bacterium]
MLFEKTLRIESLPFEADRVAITCDVGEGHWVDMTYGELVEIVGEVGRILQQSGVGKGDRILLVGENHYKWLPVFLGIAGYGAVAVPVDGTLADKRLMGIIENCNPRVIVTSKKFQDKTVAIAEQINAPCDIVNFHFDLVRACAGKSTGRPRPAAPESEDQAAIIYTSGTTGKPKGTILTHRALCASVRIGLSLGDYQTTDVMLALLPLTHVYGLVDTGLCPLSVGSKIVMTASYNPIEILQAVARFRVSYLLVVPRLAEIFAMALRQMTQPLPIPSLKMIIGGASCDPNVIKALRARGITAFQGYGMTETAGGIIACSDGPEGAVGKPAGEVEFRLGNAKNGVGELMIASPTLCSGIFGSEAETKAMFDGRFLKTGDLCEFDSKGYIHVRGRSKDVIIPPGGVNVYPDELEMRLGLLPFADEYAVFGFSEGGGEYPALVLRPSKTILQGKTPAEAQAFAEGEIRRLTADWPEWERFRRIHLTATPLPRSASQKVQRNRVVEMLGAPPAAAAAAGAAPAVRPAAQPTSAETEHQFEVFRKTVGRFLHIDANMITRERPFSDFLQLDSLGVVALVSQLCEEFRVPMRELKLEGAKDFGGLFDLLIAGGGVAAGDAVIDDAEREGRLPPLLDYSPDAVKARQRFMQKRTGAQVRCIPRPEDARSLNGNIEGFLGFAEIPLGLIGPLRVMGDHARGDYYVPLATTEGALVSSVARGAQIITLSGGARVKVLADSLVRAPIFVFETLFDMMAFNQWIENHYDDLKTAAESTTRHGRLDAIEPFPMGSTLCLRFVYATGDASGQNMTTIATHAAIKWIVAHYRGPMVDWFLESNLSGDKKVNGVNFTRNRGKRVIAEVEIPLGLVGKHLHTSAERMVRLGQLSMMTALHAHAFGSQAHYANILAAMFIAAGQDPACVAESAAGVTNLELRQDRLAVSVTMPGLMVGTVGGGTRLPTQQACLQMLECDGPRKSRKLAEIVAAAVLAGEISLIAAMAADEFAGAHARYGRSGGRSETGTPHG